MSEQKRLWVERNGIHTTQAFYAVEYPFANTEEVERIIAIIDLYNRWVKILYDMIRHGVALDDLPPMPEELRVRPVTLSGEQVAEKQVRNKKA